MLQTKPSPSSAPGTPTFPFTAHLLASCSHSPGPLFPCSLLNTWPSRLWLPLLPKPVLAKWVRQISPLLPSGRWPSPAAPDNSGSPSFLRTLPDFLSVFPQLTSLCTRCSLGESLQDHSFKHHPCADATHPRPSSKPCILQPTWYSKASQRHMWPTELRAITSRGTCSSPFGKWLLSSHGSVQKPRRQASLHFLSHVPPSSNSRWPCYQGVPLFP